MAFTNTPTQDTYSTAQIPLFSKLLTRQGVTAKDGDYLNLIVDVEKGIGQGDSKIFLMKRAGALSVIPTLGSVDVRGMYFRADTGKFYYAVNDDIIVYTVSSGATVTLNTVFGTSVGEVGFEEFLYADGTVDIIATDGTTLVTISATNVVVPCTDPGLPVPHIPRPLALDGYLFLAELNTAFIHNSDIDTPLLFVGASPISTEMEGDWIRTIAKTGNYIVALGSTSIEYFWNAQAPGSPLQRNDTPLKNIKYLSGLCKKGTEVFFIGAEGGESPAVYRLKEFKAEKVSSPTIDRYLAVAGDTHTTWTLNVLSFFGRTFLLLNAGTTRSWMLDLDTSFWTIASWKNETLFSMKRACQVEDSFGVYTWFSMEGFSTIYSMSDTTYQDAGTNIPVRMETDRMSFGSLYRKFASRLSLLGDRTTTNVNVSWSDDDYTTYSTPRAIALNSEFPSIWQLGSFKLRSFRFTHQDNTPLRLYGIELDINKGNR